MRDFFFFIGRPTPFLLSIDRFCHRYTATPTVLNCISASLIILDLDYFCFGEIRCRTNTGVDAVVETLQNTRNGCRLYCVNTATFYRLSATFIAIKLCWEFSIGLCRPMPVFVFFSFAWIAS